jgi:hypothetical protein
MVYFCLKFISMRKLIDIDEKTLTKLKVISIFEKTSVKGLIENAVQIYVKSMQSTQFNNLTDEEKEDVGLLMLMQEVDRNDKVSEEEIFKILGK